jgi:hypothetical protein
VDGLWRDWRLFLRRRWKKEQPAERIAWSKQKAGLGRQYWED